MPSKRSRSWQERSHKRVESKQGYTTALRRQLLIDKLRNGDFKTKKEFLDYVSREALGNVEGAEHLYMRPTKV